ncbi:MAG: tetratricopeptide repeat protein [Ferruginibacter sp.]
MRSKTTTLSVLMLFASLLSAAQDSLNFISGSDATFMRKKAETVVKSFNEVLNILAGKDQSMIEEVTKNSYKSNYKSRIFLDSSVRINEDIDPSSTTQIAALIPVARYLNTFYLEYDKSNDPSSVEMNILKVSYPKRAFDADTAYPLVKVFFSSYFHNKNKHHPNDEYRTTNRYADVRLIRDQQAWFAYIQRMGFFVSEDTLQNFTKDDIPLSSAEELNDTTYDAAQKRILLEEKKLKDEARRILKKQYDSLITVGDNILQRNDHNQAIIAYTRAKEILPDESLADLRIADARRKQDDANIIKKTEAQTFSFNAKKEEIKRNYPEAIKWYKAASKANQEQSAVFDAKIDELTKKFNVVADLEEKYNAGMYKIVLEDYEKAIKKNKENSDLYLGRARCYDKLNYFDKAIQDCDNALEKDPNNFPALLLRANLKSESTNANELLEGVSDYGKCVNIYEYDSSIYELKSALRLKAKPGYFDEAIKDIDNGIQVNPKWSNLHYQKGVLLLKKADYRNAKTAFTNAIDNKAAYPTAYFQRGIAQLQLNNTDDAAADFKKAIEYKLDSSSQKQIQGFADNFYRESKRTFSDGKTDSAIWYINKAIILYRSSEFYFKKGIYQVKEKKYAEAVSSLTSSTGSDPKNADAFYYLAVAYAGQKDLQAAAKHYTQAIKLNETHLSARKELGDVYYMMGNDANAIDSYNGFIATLNTFTKMPPEGEFAYQVYNSLGKSYFAKDSKDINALNSFKEAIKRKKDFAEGWYNAGIFYNRNNDINSAIKSFESAVSIDSKNTDYNKKLALSYLERGSEADLKKAMDCFNTALTATNHSDIWFPMATCNLKQQNYSGALEYYHNVIADGLDGINKTFDYEIGYTYLNLGKVDSAMIYLQKEYLKDSSDDKSNLAYAIALWQKGNTEDSVRLFEKIIQAGKISKKEIKNERLMATIKNEDKLKSLLK